MKTRAGKILVKLIIVGLLLAAAGYYLLYSNQGLKAIIKTIDAVTPGSLTIEKVQGNFASSMYFENFSYKYKKTHINIDKLRIEWHPYQLLLHTLDIAKLDATGIKINLPPSQQQKSDGNYNPLIIYYHLRNLHLPVKLNLTSVLLQKITIQKEKQTASIDHINLQLTTTKSRINAINFALSSNSAKLNISGALTDSYNFNWNANIANLKNIVPGYSGSVVVNGSLDGKLKHPHLINKITINKFDSPFAKIDNCYANLALNLVVGEKSTLELSGRNIAFGQYSIAQIGVSGDTTISALTPRKLAAQLHLAFAPTTIALKSGYQTHHLILQGGVINAQITQHGITSQIKMQPLHQAALKAQLAIRKYKTITGEADWTSNRLTFLPLLFPKITDPRGDLQAQVKISGSIFKPLISGSLSLEHGSASIPSLKLKLTNIQLKAEAKRSIVNYQLSMHSGKGTLRLVGNANLSSPDLMAKLELNGQNVLVSNLENTKVYVSPELKIIYKDHAIDIDGKIVIPQATISRDDFRQAVTLPKDVVYVGDKTQYIFVKAKKLRVYTRVQLILLGDNININIMGVKGQLYGKLFVRDEPGRATSGVGSINIKNGKYNAYGQNLTLRYANLTFSGGPITNPVVNVEAVKTIKSVSTSLFDLQNQDRTVGVRLQGPLQHPKTTLFSEPSNIPQADILSYLVLGVPSSSVGENQAGTLMQAANILNFGGSGGLGNLNSGLRKKFGFAQFGFETESTTDENTGDLVSNTSFVLGKYLSPSLYVSYSVGLLQPVNTFRVRYKLGKHWAVQSESSTLGNGVDLLYSIARK